MNMPQDHEKMVSALCMVSYFLRDPVSRAPSGRSTDYDVASTIAKIRKTILSDFRKVDRNRVSLRVMMAVDRILEVTAPGMSGAISCGGLAPLAAVQAAVGMGMLKPKLSTFSDKTLNEQLAGRMTLITRALNPDRYNY